MHLHNRTYTIGVIVVTWDVDDRGIDYQATSVRTIDNPKPMAKQTAIECAQKWTRQFPGRTFVAVNMGAQ